MFLLYSVILLGRLSRPRSDIRLSGLLHDYNTSSENQICGLCESFAVMLFTGFFSWGFGKVIYSKTALRTRQQWGKRKKTLIIIMINLVTVTLIFFVSSPGTSDTTSNGYPALSATAHPHTAMVSHSQPGFVSNCAITLVQGCTYNRGQRLGQDILPTMCSQFGRRALRTKEWCCTATRNPLMGEPWWGDYFHPSKEECPLSILFLT